MQKPMLHYSLQQLTLQLPFSIGTLQVLRQINGAGLTTHHCVAGCTSVPLDKLNLLSFFANN